VSRLLVPLVTAAAAVLALGACGDDSHEFAGYVREPLPQVGDVELLDASNDLAPFPLRAEPGKLLITYFGYMNCPDFCPTTMSDVKLALARIDEPDRVDVAMVTVDPERDFRPDPDRCEGRMPLACYVNSFIEGSHALGTDDPAVLERAAAPLGVNYSVVDTGESIQVSHSTSLFAIDDEGQLVLTWQHGIPIDELAADIAALLEAEAV
jgi:protein SCO1/2